MVTDRHYPFPEIMPDEGPEWEVLESRAHPQTDQHRKVMLVPLGDSDVEANVRGHELCHVRHSPKQPHYKRYGVEKTIVQAVEDLRMHMITSKVVPRAQWRAGLMTEAQRNHVVRQLAHGPTGEPNPEYVPDLRAMTLALTSIQGSYDAREVRSDLMEIASESPTKKKTIRLAIKLAEYAHEHMRERLRGKPSFRRTVKVAKWLEESLFLASPHRKKKERLRKKMPAHGFGNPDEGVARDRVEEFVGRGLGARDKHKVPWGRMNLIKAPMPLRLPPLKMSRKKRCSEEGILPLHMHRMCMDQKVFVQLRRQAGGTLLLDCSGSMGFSEEEIREVVDLLPMATIALYGGRNDDGDVLIVAEKGRRAMAEDICSPGGANVIDGPALDWLAAQKSPRIWISDGQVTGIGDSQGWGNVRECATTVQRNNIAMYRSMGEALEVLRGKMRNHRSIKSLRGKVIARMRDE
jgi:hypothetical protein